ncbi:hypothetical protein CR513_44876, partial [Mucuna pruriens]
MYPPDAYKTTFMTNRSTNYYQVMPFGLKNARATYQRLINEVFACNLEVYVDDMVVKSAGPDEHMKDL